MNIPVVVNEFKVEKKKVEEVKEVVEKKEKMIKDSKGKEAIRDIVQFVPYRDNKHNYQ